MTEVCPKCSRPVEITGVQHQKEGLRMAICPEHGLVVLERQASLFPPA